MNRRELLTSVTVAALAPRLASGRAPRLGSGQAARTADATLVQEAAAIGVNDGELVYVGRDPVRIKIGRPGSPGRLGMITQDVSPGTSIPVHLHEREDEVIFIQDGTGEATVGDRRVNLAAGSTLFVPQGTWHGGRNTGSGTLKWIAIYSPSGFEGYFREIGKRAPDDPPPQLSAAERDERDRRYGIRYR